MIPSSLTAALPSLAATRATGSPLMLASVTSATEALQATAAGADVIDAKNPHEGALGALPAETVRAIRHALGTGALLSATIGDLPADGGMWCAAARTMAATGVDFVKIGIFTDGDPSAAIREVGRVVLSRARLVAVLLADRGADVGLLPDLAAAGFAGVMLDTADKSSAPLPALLPSALLRSFVSEAHRYGLFAGLAGSLRLGHVAPLAALGPDLLGFRGALCLGEVRTAALDPGRIGTVRDALRSAGGAPASETTFARATELPPA